jgi:hypothetical protein
VSAHVSPSERKPAFFPAIAESQVQAMQGAVFFYLPSMLLSGFMFPFQGMPSWAQLLGEVLPLTHLVRAQAGQETPKLLSFRSAGAARESGTHEHRTQSPLELQVLRGSGPALTGASRNDGFWQPANSCPASQRGRPY